MSIAEQEVLAERLHIADWEWRIVAEILRKYLPGKTVWAFGSRATGRHVRRFSDLDLAVEGRLTWNERGAVSEALDESLVSFKVDLVELALVDAEFKARGEKDFVVLQGPGSTAFTA